MREPLTDWNKERAACADEAAEQARNELLPAWFKLFLTNVCELPFRNSPDDEPEAIFATLEELRTCAISAIEQCFPLTPTVAPASSPRVDESCKCRRLGDWKGFHHPLCDKASENEQDHFVKNDTSFDSESACSPATVLRFNSELTHPTTPWMCEPDRANSSYLTMALERSACVPDLMPDRLDIRMACAVKSGRAVVYLQLQALKLARKMLDDTIASLERERPR
ncbi:hypothetical protein [Burkholderia gladioli]|uniref:hypothetical protein n=1 Tax=Burkholderia gladioli TaxID=28095 RepID=UPI001C5D098C|nr:hypothetical protein [Burkholderia gladioli]MBW5284195.1 hypothetical protein [Burkholderia gladioli]